MADLFLAINPFYLNVAQVYLRYSLFIDSIIALVLFVSIANWVFAKKYGKEHDGHKVASKESKLIATAVGLALTVGFAVFETRTAFNFGKLGPLSVLVLLLFLGIFFYELLLGAFGNDRKGCAFATTYLVIFGLFLSVQSGVLSDLYQRYSVVWGMLNIGFLIAFIKFIMCLIGMFTGGSKGDAPHGEDHEKEEKEHDEELKKAQEEMHAPLAVNILLPHNGQEYKPEDEVTVEGTVVGGVAPLWWRLQSTSGADIKGVGDHVHASLGRLRAGNHVVVVAAQDKHKTVSAKVQFSVQAPAATPTTPGGASGTADAGPLLDRIRLLRTILEQYARSAGAYLGAAQTVLTENRKEIDGQPHHLAGAFFGMQRAAQQVADQGKLFTDTLDAIRKDAQYPNLSPEHYQELGAAVAQYFQLLAELNTSQHAFENHVNSGGAFDLSPPPGGAR